MEEAEQAAHTGDEDEDEESDKNWTAEGCLQAIGNIIYALSNHPDLLAQCEQSALMVVRKSLELQNIDSFYGEAMNIVKLIVNNCN